MRQTDRDRERGKGRGREREDEERWREGGGAEGRVVRRVLGKRGEGGVVGL